MGGTDQAWPHDWRLVPVAAAAWAASWMGTAGWTPGRDVVMALLAGVGLLGVMAGRSGRRWTALTLAVLAVGASTAGLQSHHRHTSAVAQLAEEGATATVLLRLRAEPQPGRQASIGRAELVWAEARGRRIQAAVPIVVIGVGTVGEELLSLTAGAEYLLEGRLAATERDDAAAALLRLRRVVRQTAEPGLLDAGANAMRAGLRSAVAHSPPDQAALVPSLVVGDTSAVDGGMRDNFQATGLTHLMAVSGANLTLMLGVVLAVARAVGVRGWAVRAAAVAGVLGFVVLCGQDPSVLRAAAMGLVALAAVGVGRGRRSVRALSVAVLALVWLDPWLSRSAGFALSVAACAGIVLLGPRLVGAMTRWAPRWLAEAIAIPLAAQVATQPIVTALSEQVSVIGVVTNALAGPFVGPTTILGLGAALLWFVPVLAVGPGWLAGWCSQPILWLADGGAALPSAAWEWQPTAAGLTIVAGAALGATWVLPRLLARRWGFVLLIGAILGGSVVRPVTLGWPGDWAVVFCDVGQGDATVLNAGGGAAVLVDAGPEAAPTLACLKSLGVRSLPMLVLSHYHSDHVGGAAAVIARFRPELILVRAGSPPDWLASAATQAGVVVREAAAGEVLGVGWVQWQTVSATEPFADWQPEPDGEGSAENDASVVAVARSRDVSVLLAGDLEPGGQSLALRSAARQGIDLSVDVLKLPHHGSSRQDPRFFEVTSASVAVASAGEGNSYGHPSASTMKLSRDLGMTVARTDMDGDVAVARRGDGLVIRTAG
ncbi:ComEC/Rec2 family competence protein [Tessaracoccus flavus]|uniref:Uncharacterized protein n=1 Tax=Tessaracoccus flavus TaxID=1610493 RepID=A0A1Q2CDM3_9ACTN|nr:ComEC/Rec2 family competence protein [Tessaracoccus flavus]AQP44222.1 hypothetical protein RPIT_04835 [Tessaracoccus flavus]SDY38751.1 competence protein ComEC [Tessaracoccus flavus]